VLPSFVEISQRARRRQRIHALVRSGIVALIARTYTFHSEKRAREGRHGTIADTGPVTLPAVSHRPN
jgi:hypothetical protein